MLPFFDELLHSASLEMFTGKPQIKSHALLVCPLGNVLSWGVVLQECLVTAWQAQLRLGLLGLCAELFPCFALQNFPFEKEWE